MINAKRLELKPEERTEPFEFHEVLDLLSQNTDTAFSCEEFEKGSYLAFDYDDHVLSFYSGGRLLSFEGNEFLIEEDKSKIIKTDFIVGLEHFGRKWYPVVFEKVYNLEVTYYHDFKDSDIFASYDKTFVEMSKEEKTEFLYELLESIIEEEPEFLIDGRNALTYEQRTKK